MSEQRYKPYGEVRWSSGAGMPTDKQFTSQTRLAEGYVGTLYDYVARAYDPVLGRFISADTIVPGAGNGQAYNRYSYALNSPLRYSDPSGHRACNDSDDCEPAGGRTDWPPPPPPQPIGAGAFVLVLAIGSTGVAAGPSILLWGAAGVLATGVMVYEAVTSNATLAFPPYPLPATEPGAIGPTYPSGGSSTLQVDIAPPSLSGPLVPEVWTPAKQNPNPNINPPGGRAQRGSRRPLPGKAAPKPSPPTQLPGQERIDKIVEGINKGELPPPTPDDTLAYKAFWLMAQLAKIYSANSDTGSQP